MDKRKEIKSAALERLVAAIHKLETPEETVAFLEELLTASELRDVVLRWVLLERLVEGVSQRKIAKDLKISLCKITRGSRILKDSDSVAARLLRKE